MHLNAKRPVFVPEEYCEEIEKLSKAALMDLVWDIASVSAGSQERETIISLIRRHSTVVLHYRKTAAKSYGEKYRAACDREVNKTS